jgi:hypothetical protein
MITVRGNNVRYIECNKIIPQILVRLSIFAGLAIDWISRNMYITDPGREVIEVIGLDTKMR